MRHLPERHPFRIVPHHFVRIEKLRRRGELSLRDRRFRPVRQSMADGAIILVYTHAGQHIRIVGRQWIFEVFGPFQVRV